MGKADLVRVMSGLTGETLVRLEAAMMSSGVRDHAGPHNEERNRYPSHVLEVGYDCDVDCEKGKQSLFIHGSCSCTRRSKLFAHDNGPGCIVNLSPRVTVVFTAVPYDRTVKWIEDGAHTTCDLVALVLDCNDGSALRGEEEDEAVIADDNGDVMDRQTGMISPVTDSDSKMQAKGSEVEKVLSSLLTVQRFEALLPAHLPRIFVANRSDLLVPQSLPLTTDLKNSISSSSSSLMKVKEYLQEQQLPPLLLVSTVTGEGIDDLKQTILHIVSNPDVGIPFSLRKKKRSMDYFSSKVIVGLGLVAMAVVTKFYFFPSAKNDKKSDR